MTKRKVSPELVAAMRQELSAQEAPVSAYAKTDDNNFPVFSAYVNKAILVYIPKTPVTVNADGVEVANPCVSYQHAIKDGNSFANIRCINGLHYDALGYDGECPLCNAVSECNSVYSKKLSLKANQLHVDIDKDPKNPLLESIRNELNGERVVKRAEKFLTIPIVVLSEDLQANAPIDPNNFKTFFWDVREQHFNDKLMKMLSSQMPPIESPYGRFYVFNYVYDTKGQEATKMLAAKNVVYQLANAEQAGLTQYIPVCEELAKPFTDTKAVEVIRSVQLWYKDDLTNKVDNIMQSQRSFLAAANGAVAAIGTAVPASNSVAETLNNFGAVPAIEATPAPAVAVAPTIAPAVAPTPVAPAVAPVPTVAPTVAVAPVAPTPVVAPTVGVAPQIPGIGAV